MSFFSGTLFRYAALKNNIPVAFVNVFDVQDKRKSARKKFVKMGIEFDEIKFMPPKGKIDGEK